jgi:hypothetical protein
MQRLNQFHMIRHLFTALLVGASLAIPHAAASQGNPPPATPARTAPDARILRSQPPALRPDAVAAPASIMATPVITSFKNYSPIGDGAAKMTICGSDLISATQVLFNGQYPAKLYSWVSNRWQGSCWMTTVPVVDPPDAVNGPLVIVAPNGIATSTTDFTAKPFELTSIGSTYRQSESVSSNHAWFPDGKYYVLTGPYLGTATEVVLDGAPVSFRSAGLLRLLLPVTDFDTLTHTLAITTPYGSAFNDFVSFAAPMVTNMILPNLPGSFEIRDPDPDLSPSWHTKNAYRDRDGFVLPGNAFLYSYHSYIDTNNAVTPTILAQSNVTTDPTLIGPNLVFASGTLTSATTSRTIQWSSVGSIEPYSQEYYVTVTFTDTAGLGPLKLRTRLDEDIWDRTNDMMAMLSTPGEPDFVIMTPDGPVRIGFGAKGIYTNTTGLLENAAWDGFAAGDYYEMDEWINNHTLNYETTAVPGAYITGTTANIDLATSEDDYYCALAQAEAGWYSDTVYLTDGCDMGASMSWTADPAATTTKITHILLNVASDPTSDSVAGLDDMVATVAGQSVSFAPSPFVSSTLVYTDATPHAGTSAILTPTLSDALGAVAVMQVTAPGASAPVACALTPFTCPLEVGVNRIDVVVLSADSQRSQSYSFFITRGAPPPPVPFTSLSFAGYTKAVGLQNLAVSPGTLTPAHLAPTDGDFAAFNMTPALTTTTQEYTITVPYEEMALVFAFQPYAISYTLQTADGTFINWGAEGWILPQGITATATLTTYTDSGIPSLVYTVHVERAAPARVPLTANYTTIVPVGTSTVAVTAGVTGTANVSYTASAGACTGAVCPVSAPKSWITTTVSVNGDTAATYGIEVTFGSAPSTRKYWFPIIPPQ